MGARIWTATNDDYVRVLRDYLPRGVLWTREAARRLTRHLQGIADELVRVHNSAADLLTEADPQTTTDTGMMEDWERVLGLPEFNYAPTDEDLRRTVILGKLAAQGGQSADYFEGLAVTMGVADCTVGTTPWDHVWSASMPAEITRARCNSKCNAQLVEMDPSIEPVVLAFQKYKPAHTRIWWTGA